MNIVLRWLLPVLAGLALAGCQTGMNSTALPSGQAAYEIAPATDTAAKPQAYRIGPGDVISVQVFQGPSCRATRSRSMMSAGSSCRWPATSWPPG